MNLTVSNPAFSVCGVPVQRVAFGAEQLGGYGWGAVDVAEIEKAIVFAIESGVTLFDTADCYGRGESERRLGAMLKTVRSQVFVSTKFGVCFDQQGCVYYDNNPDYAERALEASLERLGMDCVDLLQLHWPDGHTPLTCVFERLEQLREDGRIRWYGVSNVPFSEIAELSGHWPGFVSFSAQYSLVHRSQEAIIRGLCLQRGLCFLGWGSLGQGLLSGKYGRESTFEANDRRKQHHYQNFHGEKLEQNLALVEQLRVVSSRFPDVSPSQVAIRFILKALPQSIAIVGVKNEGQIKANLGALSIPFHDDDYELLDGISSWALEA